MKETTSRFIPAYICQPPKKNLAGQTFNYLDVVVFAGRKFEGEALWKCLCKCGQTRIVCQSKLLSGLTSSCGCRPKNIKTHGRSKKGDRTYTTWRAIIARCSNQKLSHWKLYGGRGIKICERWRESFENFLADMGERPEGKTIDRFPDPDGNYEPGNCRWATHTEQMNNLRSTRYVTIDGVRDSVSNHARAKNVPHYQILKLFFAERGITSHSSKPSLTSKTCVSAPPESHPESATQLELL